MIQDIVEVPESEAQGKVKTTYDDIKSTLRVPLVNLVFRMLAAYPDYLQVAWATLKPNAQTVYFERRADYVRQRATELVSNSGTAPAPPDDQVAGVLDVFHYVNPKILLAVAALRSASTGQRPRLEELPAQEKRQIAPGIPKGAAPISLVDEASLSDATRSLLEDIKSTLGSPVINSDFRALAAWPDYLESAWAATKPMLAAPAFRALQRELHATAEQTVIALPYRMDIGPHIQRQIGMSEADIDAVRGILNSLHGSLPALIATVAFWQASSRGRDSAADSPFPPDRA